MKSTIKVGNNTIYGIIKVGFFPIEEKIYGPYGSIWKIDEHKKKKLTISIESSIEFLYHLNTGSEHIVEIFDSFIDNIEINNKGLCSIDRNKIKDASIIYQRDNNTVCLHKIDNKTDTFRINIDSSTTIDKNIKQNINITELPSNNIYNYKNQLLNSIDSMFLRYRRIANMYITYNEYNKKDNMSTIKLSEV